MNRKIWVSGLALLTMCGCSTMNNTERGAVTGGAVGAIVGTGIGAMARNPLAGAAIGTGVGALTGAAIGNGEDRFEAKQKQAAAQAAAQYAATHPQLTIPQIVQMSQSHTGDDLILQQMHSTNSYYNLTPEDIEYLRQQGVSNRVISEMIARRGPAPVVVQPRPVVVVEQPPPPVAVGVGFGWGPRYYYGRRW